MSAPEHGPPSVTWHLTPEQRRQWLGQRLSELAGWRDRFGLNLSDWTFTAPGSSPQPIHLGDPWPVLDQSVSGGPAVFETAFEVPPTWAGSPVEVELDVGGEGLVRLSTGLAGGLNPYHRRFPVAGGGRVTVRVEAVPKNLFGARNAAPRLMVARLAVPEEAVRALILDLEVVVEAAGALGGQVAPHLLAAAETALAGLSWPSAADEYLARLENVGGWKAADLWNVPGERPEPTPLDGAQLEAVKTARAVLREHLDQLKTLFPPLGELAVSGHAHLDLGWLWPVAETRRKGERTFETVLALMDRFPDFTFNQSSAQLYAWLEERPELFARILERVREGRIEAVGGMWVEPDGQLPSGEAWARQLLYGQRYFQQKFGRRSTVAWLPDTFGFTPALPQLLLGAGIPNFFTTKLNWNETTDFPHDLFLWEGLDGSRVLAHCFKDTVYSAPGLGTYNGDLAPGHTAEVWGNFKGKHLSVWRRGAPASLFTYGYGDGGGGPSAEMLERFGRLTDFPASPRLRHTRVDDFFASLPRQGLPLWVGELYLELHRGTLSSQGRVKRLNREAEARLTEAEVAASLAFLKGTAYPHAELEAAWKTLLLNQFHDILPGSSIREVYEVAERELGGVAETATRLGCLALANLATPEEGTFTVFNPSLNSRPLRAVLPSAEGSVRAGERELPTQAVSDGLLVWAPEVLVPPLGGVTLHLRAGEASPKPGVRAELQNGGALLENDLLRVEVAPDGTLTRVYDKEAGREVLNGPGNRLTVFRDVPRAWEAWDVNADVQRAENGEDLSAQSVEVTETGSLRASLRVTRRWRDSEIAQTYLLHAGSRRLDIQTYVNWREKRTLVKTFFPLNVRAPSATFETAYGAQERPTHRNTPYDAARFEVSGHRFADLSEPNYGVSLLNDGLYAHTALGSTLGLTLLRAPLFPDPGAGLGELRFSYALYPHAGDWTRGGTVLEALDLNSPLLVTPGEGELAPPFKLGGLPVMLGALKRAEDDGHLILRFYEPHGDRGELTLEGVRHLERVNLLEEPGGEPPEFADGRWKVQLRPFEIVTLKLRLTS